MIYIVCSSSKFVTNVSTKISFSNSSAFAFLIKEGLALSKAPAECDTETFIELSVSKTPFKTNTGSCVGISKSITVSISEQEMMNKKIKLKNETFFIIKKFVFYKKLKE